MLQKRERLTRIQFSEAFKSGRRYHSPTLTLIHTPSEHFHGAVVVGKKVAKRAVVRNTLRRRVYGALYRTLHPNPPGGTFIIIAKSGLAELPRRDISNEVAELVGRVVKKR